MPSDKPEDEDVNGVRNPWYDAQLVDVVVLYDTVTFRHSSSVIWPPLKTEVESSACGVFRASWGNDRVQKLDQIV
jgi:hypothetical protein